MIINYLPTLNTCLINDKKILLIAKIPFEGTEQKINSGINFYKKFLNCDTLVKSNNEPNIFYFGQEIKLAKFVDISSDQIIKTIPKSVQCELFEQTN